MQICLRICITYVQYLHYYCDLVALTLGLCIQIWFQQCDHFNFHCAHMVLVKLCFIKKFWIYQKQGSIPVGALVGVWVSVQDVRKLLSALSRLYLDLGPTAKFCPAACKQVISAMNTESWRSFINKQMSSGKQDHHQHLLWSRQKIDGLSCFLFHCTTLRCFCTIEEKLNTIQLKQQTRTLKMKKKTMPGNRSLGKLTTSLCISTVATTENNSQDGSKCINYMAKPKVGQNLSWEGRESLLLLNMCVWL